jgi:uncharacterized membrane protein YgdD (TMEM256/DUF423 family)
MRRLAKEDVPGMPSTAKLFLAIGSINAALGVLCGAFGAHALKTRLSADLLAAWQTGVHYQLVHALGLLVVGLAAHHLASSASLKWSGWLMFTGIVLFSGSLYLLSITGMRWAGLITPLGGVSFIAAWILLAVAAVKSG